MTGAPVNRRGLLGLLAAAPLAVATKPAAAPVKLVVDISSLEGFGPGRFEPLRAYSAAEEHALFAARRPRWIDPRVDPDFPLAEPAPMSNAAAVMDGRPAVAGAFFAPAVAFDADERAAATCPAKLEERSREHPILHHARAC